jgi:hypothetical protein
MPAVVPRTVAASGGDYTSLEAFNVGEARDLVTADEIAQAVCEAFADTNTQVTFNTGWTTDADRHVHIVAAAGAEAQMPWEPTNAYRLVGPIAAGTTCLTLSVHAVVERIQIELHQYSFPQNQAGVMVSGGVSLVMDGCVIRGVEHVDNTGPFHGASIGDGSPFHIRNTYFLDFNGTSGADAWAFKNSTNGATRYLYNCTAINCNRGFDESLSFSPVVLKNCHADSRGITGAINFGATYHADSTNNASDLTDAPGTDSRNSQTFTYEDAGAGDWRLTAADAGAREHGADLSADSVHPFSTDFFGTTRPQGSAWDIGAFELESGEDPQFARPEADLLSEGWTGDPDNTDLFSNIAGASPDDGSHIQSALGPTAGSNRYRAQLGAIEDPGEDTGFVLRIRTQRIEEA